MDGVEYRRAEVEKHRKFSGGSMNICVGIFSKKGE
jgi:hypothetical protein